MLYPRLLVLAALMVCVRTTAVHAARPNVLLVISDDQSDRRVVALEAASARTPAFDRVASAGRVFDHCYAASPGCSPSRAALLTGRHAWELREAGTHASSFPKEFATFPDLLEAAGYHVGMTGKGWGPGNWKISGRTRNPAGPDYSRIKQKSPQGISNNDYAANFAAFLEEKPDDAPFCFWFGAHEPHRPYAADLGKKAGIDTAAVDVPAFLPDTPEVRDDIANYQAEIEWFDAHLGRMLDQLAARGELANTLVIVTSDNGMPFPTAKANCYAAGLHVPLAIAWPDAIPAGGPVTDLAGFIDLAPTILEAAGVPVPPNMTGRSFLSRLKRGGTGGLDKTRDAVFFSRERHSSSRYNNLGYPIRGIVMRDDGDNPNEYLLVRNFHPDRWPAGDPHETGQTEFAFADIDDSPTKSLLIERRHDPAIRLLFDFATAKRPAVELYSLSNDPWVLPVNRADDPQYAAIRQRLERRLAEEMQRTGDPRAGDNGEVWETYPRYSPLRRFPNP